MMLPPVPNYQDQMQADMQGMSNQLVQQPLYAGGALPPPPDQAGQCGPGMVVDPNTGMCQPAPEYNQDLNAQQTSYDAMANQALPPVPGSPEATTMASQGAVGTQGLTVPQKCIDPEGMPGTWNPESGQCIPDAGGFPPPGNTDPGTGLTPGDPCTTADGSAGIVNQNGICLLDFGNEPPAPECPDPMVPNNNGGCVDPSTGQCYDITGTKKVDCTDSPPPTQGREECEARGGTWNDTTGICTNHDTEGCADPNQYMDHNGVCRDKEPEGPECPPGEKPYMGQCWPDPGYDPDSGGCKEGFYLHPFAGCVPGDGPDDGGIDCPDGQIDRGNGCEPIERDDSDAPDKMPTPDPGDPFDVGTSPGADPVGDPVNGVDPVKVAESDSFNYDEVQKHIDDAMANAERYLAPQEQMEDERFKQELINQGIDPYSAAGQKALKQKQIGQNDRRSKAMFDAMSFGKDMQAQMWDQEAFETTNAKDLNELIANLGQRAHEFDITAGMTADEMNWGKIADVMGWNRQDFYDWRDENRWIDSLIFAMAGLTPPAQFHGGTVNPSQIANSATG